jgi:hypothetical protein
MLDPLSPEVLRVLQAATGLGKKESWNAIFLLVSKSEHNNEDPAKAFLTDKGTSVFTYASALPYDMKQRGVTTGLVGYTTADGGKDGHGDAPVLFRQYKALGGEDLMPFIPGCTTSKDACAKLIAKIRSLDKDPAWVQAQFQNLVTDDGYLAQTMRAWKKLGIAAPSPLALATLFDHNLNCGFDGKDGGTANMIKLGVPGDEDASLKKFNAWRRTVAGKNCYNDPPSNGLHRADMFEELRKAKCYQLDDMPLIKKSISWTMK